VLNLLVFLSWKFQSRSGQKLLVQVSQLQTLILPHQEAILEELITCCK
jgi:hypothetical protein